LAIPQSPKSWFDRIPESMRLQVVELMEARKRGVVKLTYRQIAELLTANGIKCNANKIKHFICEHRFTSRASESD
jgi:hypothetical protein